MKNFQIVSILAVSYGKILTVIPNIYIGMYPPADSDVSRFTDFLEFTHFLTNSVNLFAIFMFSKIMTLIRIWK